MEFDNNDKGVAFLNEKKDKETQPDFRGKGNFNGTDFEFGMWERTSKTGKSYFSFSFSEPYKKAEGSPSWEARRQEYAKPKDEVLTDEEVDQPIDLSEIPF